jgi:hypothetical protein
VFEWQGPGLLAEKPRRWASRREGHKDETVVVVVVVVGGQGDRDVQEKWPRGCSPRPSSFSRWSRSEAREQQQFSPWPADGAVYPGSAAARSRAPAPGRWLNQAASPARAARLAAADAEPRSRVSLRTAGSLATESIIPSRWRAHGVMDITHDSLRQSRNSLVTRTLFAQNALPLRGRALCGHSSPLRMGFSLPTLLPAREGSGAGRGRGGKRKAGSGRR